MCNKKIVDEMIHINKNIMNTLNSNMESLVNLIEEQPENEEVNFYTLTINKSYGKIFLPNHKHLQTHHLPSEL